MGHMGRSRVIGCLSMLLVVCCLTGCSVSFGGYTIGGKEELVFTCDEEISSAVTVGTKSTGSEGSESEVSSEESRSLPVGDVSESVSEGETDTGKIDLNSADLEELMTLNGIGESRAKAIIEYRTSKGAFTSIEEIMQIPGIKEGIFSKIKNQIIVR